MRPTLARPLKPSPAAVRPRTVRAMAAAKPAVELWVKGVPSTSELLDCPFCHRVLLAAGEKSVPLTLGYIDFAAKPDWLLQVNPAGSVPVAKDLESGDWVVDSGVICDWLEDKWPAPALGKTADAPSAGSDVFPAFVAYLKSSGDEEAAKKEALHTALKALDAHLAAGGPWIGGAALGQADCALAPKLHHMQVALRAFKGWELPGDAARVGDYLAAWRARPSWTAHAYSDAAVVAGWKRHLGQ